MSLSCVELPLFFSGNMSCFCLFSYTFRLRSSFYNIFFSGLAPHATFPLRSGDRTFPASDNLSCVFAVDRGIRHFLQAPQRGCRVPRPSLPLDYSRAQAYCQENSCPFFYREEKTLEMGSTLSCRKENEVAGFPYLTLLAPYSPSRRRVKKSRNSRHRHECLCHSHSWLRTNSRHRQGCLCHSRSGLAPIPLPRNDACPFFNRDRLVRFDIRETLDFLSRRPFHLDQIDHLAASQAEVQAKVTL